MPGEKFLGAYMNSKNPDQLANLHSLIRILAKYLKVNSIVSPWEQIPSF